MPTRVVDASAAAAFLFVEAEASEVAAALSDAKLLAPTLFAYELANICIKKLRADPARSTVTLARYERLPRLRVEHCEVDVRECLDLARQLMLTAYDAAYLWLARSERAELVTLDKKLARAATI